jgi:hypothetical protein
MIPTTTVVMTGRPEESDKFLVPIQQGVCPLCQRPYAPELFVSGPIRRRVVDIVAQRPDGITTRDLHKLVYTRGPRHPNTIPVLIFNANKQLEHQGYAIRPMWKGRGARYHLVKCDDDPIHESAQHRHARSI